MRPTIVHLLQVKRREAEEDGEDEEGSGARLVNSSAAVLLDHIRLLLPCNRWTIVILAPLESSEGSVVRLTIVHLLQGKRRETEDDGEDEEASG